MSPASFQRRDSCSLTDAACQLAVPGQLLSHRCCLLACSAGTAALSPMPPASLQRRGSCNSERYIYMLETFQFYPLCVGLGDLPPVARGDLPPVVCEDQNSANVCPCACRKRRLIMGYKLSYTTGLLYARSSCMQWGVWVWTVGHWVVLVQVIYCSKGGWVLF